MQVLRIENPAQNACFGRCLPLFSVRSRLGFFDHRVIGILDHLGLIELLLLLGGQLGFAFTESSIPAGAARAEENREEDGSECERALHAAHHVELSISYSAKSFFQSGRKWHQ